MKINTNVTTEVLATLFGKFVIFEGAVNLTLINDANIVLKKAYFFSLINEKKNRRLHLGFHQATLQLVMF